MRSITIFVANQYQRNTRFGWWAAACQTPQHLDLIDVKGAIGPPHVHQPRHRER
jgi:hypothetical protein